MCQKGQTYKGNVLFKLFAFFHSPNLFKGCAKWTQNTSPRRCLEHEFDSEGVETWQLFDIEDFNEGWHHMRAYAKSVQDSNNMSKLFENITA